MVDMIVQHILPSVKEAEVGPIFDLEAVVADIKRDLHTIHQVCCLTYYAF